MVIALLVAAAAVVWPAACPALPGDAGRPPGLFFDRRAPGRPVTGRAAVVALMVLAAAVLLVQWGVAVAISGAVLGATGWGLWRRLKEGRARRVALEQIVTALRMLARELHSGADPASAARSTAAATTGDGAAVMSELVHAIGTADRPSGGARNVSKPLPAARAPTNSGSGTRVRLRTRSAFEPRTLAVARLRSGWTLTRRHGIAFTPLIDALAAELAEQLVADAQRAGEVAGPKMSGYVMALLPLLGLLLGAGMGANPVEVLFRTHIGNVLLVVGTALTCAGLLWSARIVAR